MVGECNLERSHMYLVTFMETHKSVSKEMVLVLTLYLLIENTVLETHHSLKLVEVIVMT